MLGTIPVGLAIKRTVGKGPKCTTGAITFRIRRGNGSYGSVAGKIYQDKYTYSAAMKAVNNAPAPYKRNYATAIDYWQNILTADQKRMYDARAHRRLRMSGYNLFLREALTGVYPMYVDRGDPQAYDFTINDFTKDNAWHNLNLTAIIPSIAKLLLLDVDYNNIAANRHIELRKKGQTYNKNHAEVHTRVAAQDDHAIMVVSPDGNRIIEYKVSTAGWSVIAMTVRGWWT